MTVAKVKKDLKEAIDELVECYRVWEGEGRTAAYTRVNECIDMLIESASKESIVGTLRKWKREYGVNRHPFRVGPKDSIDKDYHRLLYVGEPPYEEGDGPLATMERLLESSEPCSDEKDHT